MAKKNIERKSLDREETKQEARAKFKKNPGKFLKERVIDETITYWKERPLHAIWTFTKWMVIYYIVFGVLSGIHLDMVYCDCTNDRYDGKIMYVYNEFVEYYNENAELLQGSLVPTYDEQERLVYEFNQEFKIECKPDYKRWWEEPIKDKIKTSGYSIKKVLLKRS